MDTGVCMWLEVCVCGYRCVYMVTGVCMWLQVCVCGYRCVYVVTGVCMWLQVCIWLQVCVYGYRCVYMGYMCVYVVTGVGYSTCGINDNVVLNVSQIVANPFSIYRNADCTQFAF